ncbi:hypothetical protein LCGC14_0691410 [marine sediment metagenome]|uniref:Uncharacterized protein n=1 Tax=marine sediment metagenome TaxID=412755 RepID=A0A0F9TT97_9ZZZZ
MSPEDNFEPTEPTEEPQAEPATEEPEPEFEIAANDNAYRDNSVPDGDYQIDPQITESESYDENLVASLGKTAKEFGVNQKKFTGAIKFWEANKDEFLQDNYGDKTFAALKHHAIATGWTEGEYNGVANWLKSYIGGQRSQYEQIQKFSALSHGNVHTSTAARKMQILNSAAYKSRGNTSAEKRAHKAVCNEFLALCRE